MGRTSRTASIALSLWLGLAAPTTAGAAVSLTAAPGRVEIVSAGQKVAFTKDGQGRFLLSTFVRVGDGWEALFDGQEPLVQGAHFDLHPTEYAVVANDAGRVAVDFAGKRPEHGFPWSLRVEAADDRPGLIHFRLTCRPERAITLAGLEPQVALWMNRPAVGLAVDQGPGNIYHGSPDKEWGNGFPAAYLWDAGKEAAVFFDMTPMTWMSHRNLFRFRDCRVQSFGGDDGKRTGLGLRVVKRNFHELDAGEVVFDFSLHAAARPQRPTRLEALDALVRTFAPLHPAAAAATPPDRVAGGPARWATVARNVAADLMRPGVTWDDLRPPPGELWRDQPPFGDLTVDVLRVSPDYAVDSACEPRWNRASVAAGWDFSTCNNYLAAWLAHERMHPDPAQRRFLAAKVNTLPLFYDPKARLIRHGTRQPAHVGDREMTWQNLMFHLETAKVHQLLGPDSFDPAVGGKFLLAADTLAEFARKVDYCFPQWFDPYEKTAIVQGDEPELGIVYEPWQVGTHAYVMCRAYEMTGDDRYLGEARDSMDRLLGGGMRFKVANRRYAVEYTDPTDFPITEVFGNAWGVAAAAKLYRWTRDERHRRYSDDFLNSLLRMTYWYESALRDDPKDRAVHNAGLFRNHGGAFTGSPWETGEVYLALAVRLKHDVDDNPREPLLRLFNLYRANGFYFFPPVFPDEAIPCRKLYDHAARYLPIEDAYTHEHGGANGAMGRSVYMSGLAFWNDLMFETFAEADDPDVMTLSLDALDGLEAAAASVERNLIVFNPAGAQKSVRVRMHALADGDYRVIARDASGTVSEQTQPAAALHEGLAVALPPLGHVRLKIERDGDAAAGTREQVRRGGQAGDRLAVAYQRLQQTALTAAAGDNPERLRRLRADFDAALAAYREGQYTHCERRAAGVVEALRNN